MRRTLQSVLALLLSLALVVGGPTLGFASHGAGHRSHGHQAGADHQPAHAAGQHHAHDHGSASRPSEKTPGSSADHGSKTCCSLCTLASPLPARVEVAVRLIASRAAYATPIQFDVARAIAVDPGIPKRIG